MEELELVKRDYSLDVIEEQLTPTNQWTSSKYIDELTAISKTSMLAIALSGGCLKANANSDFSSKNKKFNVSLVNQNPLESSLSDYGGIYFQFDDYIAQINKTSNKIYSKTEIVKGILSFKSLDNNWDGFNSIPLEIDSATNALNMIDLIGEKAYLNLSDFFPNPNGTISFVWLNDDEEKVSVEIGNSTMSYFAKISSQEVQFFNKKEINVKECFKLAEIIKTL